jgi:thymidylate synthase
MNHADLEYFDLVNYVLAHGVEREDRTGTGTLSVFSYQTKFDLAYGFPLLTTKDMTKSFEHIKAEMLWMLQGSTNANELAAMGFGIWKKWADDSGELGPVYGHQMRNFNGELEHYDDLYYMGGTDQIKWIENELTTNPYSRRMLVSLWNPNQLDQMALPPCHWSFELYVEGPRLNMKLHQRSCDVFLGVPYNIAEYALLLSMFAKVHGYQPGILIHDMTNVHIYLNHLDQVHEQVTREPYQAPELVISRTPRSVLDFRMEDFTLKNYSHHEKLTGQVSI